jgi:hypothetical protein
MKPIKRDHDLTTLDWVDLEKAWNQDAQRGES